MAKRNGVAKWVGISVTLGVIFAGIIGSYAKLGNEQKHQGEDIINLEEEGCEPSQANSRSIDLIEYRLDQIQTTQTTIQADTKEILKRLPK